MLKIGLTGGIATGKSRVLVHFASLGVPTIDADVLARDVVRPGAPALAELQTRFGDDIFTADGSLDRAALAARVFADPATRRHLEAIIHPPVYRAIQDWLAALEAAGTHTAAMADIPLLYETGHQAEFDRVIVVACSVDRQIGRIVARDGISEDAARQRLTAQWPTDKKTAQADEVIWTDGSLKETHQQVERIHSELGLGSR